MDKLAEHEAFLRAIFDTPDDDLPRLVYADFLEENGEPERAEFIRVQCELANIRRQGEAFGRVSELGRREAELLTELFPEMELFNWLPEERERIRFDRGFLIPTTAEVCPGELDDPAVVREKIVRSRPHWFGVTRLSIQSGWFLQPDHIGVLFGSAALKRVTEWNLSGHVEEIAGGPQTSDAGAYALIDMHDQPVITLDGVEALARHRAARRITTLSLTYNRLDNDAARALLKSPYLVNLKRLDLLQGNRFRGEIWAQLREKFGEDVVG
jgi:uncharacterized protein (TIGR02996 family)